MGGVISGLFGGGASTPDMPAYEPAPVQEAEKEPAAKSVRDTEKRRIQARRAMAGTLLTAGQNSAGASPGGLLGRVGKQ